MKLFLTELNQVYSLLQSEQIEEAAKAFAQAMKDIDSTSLITKEPLTVDFSALEALFRVDQALCRIDRKRFWKQVQNTPKFPSLALLLDIQLFVEQCMTVYPSANDLYRASQLRHLSQQHCDLPGLQYLLALALANEGVLKANKSVIHESLEIFVQLGPLAKGGTTLDGLRTQSTIFAQTRINVLLQYLRFLDPKQALDILNNELNAGWTREAASLHDHLITRRESLADAVNLTEKMEKTFETSGQAHQIKHIEILAIFFGLIALVVATLQVVPTQPSLSQALALLLGLSLALIGALGFALGQLASNKAQKWGRVIGGFVSLGVLGIWSINTGDKNNLPPHFHTLSRDDNILIPKQPILPKTEIEQSIKSDE